MMDDFVIYSAVQESAMLSWKQDAFFRRYQKLVKRYGA